MAYLKIKFHLIILGYFPRRLVSTEQLIGNSSLEKFTIKGSGLPVCSKRVRPFSVSAPGKLRNETSNRLPKISYVTFRSFLSSVELTAQDSGRRTKAALKVVHLARLLLSS